MIEIQNVSLFYESLQALNAFSARIEKGSITGLAGINGAGKSSLIHCMLGLIREFNGTITINGHDVKQDRDWIKKHCSYAPEETELFDYLTGYEFLQLISSLKEIDSPKDQIVELSRLFDMESFLPVIIEEYSHGMRQKLLISAALLGKPEFIFIDEAINGLDTLSLFRLKDHLQKLKRDGSTIVMASHVLPILANWCDQILIIHQGKLLKILSKHDLHQTQKTIEELFIELISAHASGF